MSGPSVEGDFGALFCCTDVSNVISSNEKVSF